MLNQEFSAKNFLPLTSRQDIIKFKLGRNAKEYLENFETAANNINSPFFSFNDLGVINTPKRTIYVCNRIDSHYALKKLADNLVRLYRIKYSNRFDISQQVLNLLQENSDFYVIRTDISSFFESIDRSKLLKSIDERRLLSHKSRTLLKKLFEHNSLASTTGIPPGLSISSPLSEIYLEEFDEYAKSIPNIYFYARYVDDIIVFCSKEPIKALSAIRNKLCKFNLKLNSKKTKINHFKNTLVQGSPSTQHIEYLGYKYVETPSVNNFTRTISVQFTTAKIKKLKSRVVASLLDFGKNMDYCLLADRLNFLTSNFLLHKKQSESNLKAGIYYNNTLINSHTQLIELDNFYRHMIHRKSGPAKNLKHLSSAQILALTKNSFLLGFLYRKEFRFSENKFSKIMRCWKNED